jgi:hypothetical protein
VLLAIVAVAGSVDRIEIEIEDAGNWSLLAALMKAVEVRLDAE